MGAWKRTWKPLQKFEVCMKVRGVVGSTGFRVNGL